MAVKETGEGRLEQIASKTKSVLKANGDNGFIEVKFPDSESILLSINDKLGRHYLKVDLSEDYELLIFGRLSELGYSKIYADELISSINKKLNK